MNERDLDLIQVEVEAYFKKFLEEYTAMWEGNRADGNLYVQEGRQPSGDSQEIRGELRQPPGGEPGY